MILRFPFNSSANENAKTNKKERTRKIIDKVRKLKAFVNPLEIEFACSIFVSSYQENLKNKAQEDAMLDAATDIWLVARLLSDELGTPLKPKISYPMPILLN